LSAYPQGGAFIALPIGGFQETRFPLLWKLFSHSSCSFNETF
jgi:hypothetical protein